MIIDYLLLIIDYLLITDRLYFQDLTEEEEESYRDEVTRYLKEKRVLITDNILEYWKKNELTLPHLAKLARKYHSPPPGSAASERFFSQAKLTLTNRHNLKPKNVEMNLFLKYNVRALGYPNKYATVPEDFIPPNSSELPEAQLNVTDEPCPYDDGRIEIHSDSESDD